MFFGVTPIAVMVMVVVCTMGDGLVSDDLPQEPAAANASAAATRIRRERVKAQFRRSFQRSGLGYEPRERVGPPISSNLAPPRPLQGRLELVAPALAEPRVQDDALHEKRQPRSVEQGRCRVLRLTACMVLAVRRPQEGYSARKILRRP